jgi:hypothetical protein
MFYSCEFPLPTSARQKWISYKTRQVWRLAFALDLIAIAEEAMPRLNATIEEMLPMAETLPALTPAGLARELTA